MSLIFAIVFLIGSISALPLTLDGEPHDFLSESGVELKHLANVLMSPHVVVCDESDDHHLDHNLMDNKLVHIKEGVAAMAAIPLGMAAKGLVVAKKGAYVAGRVILKPIAIVTGLQLKMLGSGLAGAGKLVAGTGAGIAKAGTVVKYAGLGSIGLGASAIGWGLDKTTIDTHFKESQQKFHIGCSHPCPHPCSNPCPPAVPVVPVAPVIHTYHKVED